MNVFINDDDSVWQRNARGIYLQLKFHINVIGGVIYAVCICIHAYRYIGLCYTMDGRKFFLGNWYLCGRVSYCILVCIFYMIAPQISTDRHNLKQLKI